MKTYLKTNRLVKIALSLLLSFILALSSLLVGCGYLMARESSQQESFDSSPESWRGEADTSPEINPAEFEKDELYYLTTSYVFWFAEADRAFDDALAANDTTTAILFSSQIAAMFAKYFLVFTDSTISGNEITVFANFADLMDVYSGIRDCLEKEPLDRGQLSLLLESRDDLRDQINESSYIVSVMKDWTEHLGDPAEPVVVRDSPFKELTVAMLPWLADYGTEFEESIRTGDDQNALEISLLIADTMGNIVSLALEDNINASELSAMVLIAAMGNCFESLSLLLSAEVVNSEEVNRYLDLFDQMKSSFVSNPYIYTIVTEGVDTTKS